jgi:hypothetical protein
VFVPVLTHLEIFSLLNYKTSVENIALAPYTLTSIPFPLFVSTFVHSARFPNLLKNKKKNSWCPVLFSGVLYRLKSQFFSAISLLSLEFVLDCDIGGAVLRWVKVLF